MAINENIKAMVESTLAALQAKIEVLNDAIKEGKPSIEVSSLEEDVRKAEKAYAVTNRDSLFSDLSATENPIMEALKTRTYTYYKHEPVTDTNGAVTKYVLVSRQKGFDLLTFCERCGFDTKWNEKVQYLNLILTLNVATNICKMTTDEVTKVIDSYSMAEVVRETAKGGTPSSNTHIKKVLQEVIDEILFEGEGEVNKIQANVRDFNYLILTYAKKNRKQLLSVDTAKHSELRSTICDIMMRIITNGVYTVNYKMAKKSS